jgi:hypothetical protein
MVIHEAARKVLLELGIPAHVGQIHELIVMRNYYKFGAKQPKSVLGVEMSRRSINVEIDHSRPEKLFYRAAPATYGLAEWLDSNAHGSTIQINETDIDSDVRTILEAQNRSGTTKEQLVLARIGQGLFRRSVLANWNFRCAVTGSSLVVRASHIKPWSVCNDFERLDPNNGLPLVATLDALFDSQLITFNPNGQIKLSEKITRFEMELLGISGDMKLRRMPSNQMQAYLELHREIFKA